MAQKFGIDWKQGEHQRMRAFLEVMLAEAERTAKADGSKPKTKFRR